MHRISIKGVLIGGIVEVVTSLALSIPLALYAISKVDLHHMPKDQAELTITAAMNGNLLIYMGQLAIGLTCSVLGGYLAAKLAKHDELLKIKGVTPGHRTETWGAGGQCAERNFAGALYWQRAYNCLAAQ